MPKTIKLKTGDVEIIERITWCDFFCYKKKKCILVPFRGTSTVYICHDCIKQLAKHIK